MSEREDKNQYLNSLRRLPLILSEDLVIFPGIITPLVIKNEKLISIINDTLEQENKQLSFFLKRRDPETKRHLDEPDDIGCAISIVKLNRSSEGSLRLLVQGQERIKIEKVVHEDDRLYAYIKPISSESGDKMRVEALLRTVYDDFGEIIDAAPNLPPEMKGALVNITDAGPLADFVASNLNISAEERQKILSTLNVEVRLLEVSRLVNHELQLLKLGKKIQSEVSGTLEKNQREYFLREQLKAIRKELGEDDEHAETKELRKKIDDLDAPEDVIKAANKEVGRLERIPPSSPEFTVARNYLDWILDVPWRTSTEDQIDIKQARKILDRDHYGLEDVKERILEHLAVRKFKGSGRGSIICFLGPPGVGKTSIGKSIGEAMGRKFVRMSLGGLRDEAEIRGHRRTYIGALPGRIIQNIKRAGTNNPVFMLDEIDKLGSDFRGDPSSAMLEVLDPEQNDTFQDNYLELDFDLSNVMFITTANYLETIPPPLRDRMEIIKLPGYVTPEKVQIAKKYLVPRQILDNGLNTNQIKFTDKALETIVIEYTREAGVRTLERMIGKVCRKVAVKIAEEHNEETFNISTRNYTDFLGKPRRSSSLTYKSPQVGIANGLAWTPVGGVMLVIEAISMPGQGRIKITGQLGDVMKESAEIAMSLLRKKADSLKILKSYFKENDFHIHIPEGATPKDGPSAGITLASAMASLFTGRPTNPDIAMTGELTLKGRVLPIGGLREKAVAAARGNMKTVICPKDNENDLENIPDIVKDKVSFKFVENLDEVFRAVLVPKSKIK